MEAEPLYIFICTLVLIHTEINIHLYNIHNIEYNKYAHTHTITDNLVKRLL